MKMKTLNKYMTDGDFTYHITGVALVRERARDNHALQIARRLYNDHGLSSEYYTLTLSYTIANDSANTVVTRGVTAATYKNKVAMSMLTGLVNSGLATTSGVISGGSSTAMMTALVPFGTKGIRQKSESRGFAILSIVRFEWLAGHETNAYDDRDVLVGNRWVIDYKSLAKNGKLIVSCKPSV